jgi:hypothetical protein
LRKLVDAALVAPACKICVEEGEDAGPGHVIADQSAAEGQYIGVVVLTGELRGKRVVNSRAAAFRLAINGDGNADARAAS